MTPPRSKEASPGRDGWLFLTLTAITTVTAVISSLGAPLVPSIANEYDVPISTAQWILTATLITAAAATPTIGRWGSGRLRRPVMIGTLAVVLLGTVLAALPLGIGPLILGRTLQGVGLAVVPLVLAVARRAWTGERLASRLSLLSVATVSGAGLGYPLTGFLAEYAGVAGAYALGAAMVALTLLLSIRFLPRDADGEPQTVDLPSVLLIAAGMSFTLLAVSQGERWGWASATVLALAGAGVVLLAGWGLRTASLTRRGRQPLVDLRTARRPGVAGPNLVAFILGFAMYGLLTMVVLIVGGDGSAGWGLDRSALSTGLVLTPYALASVFGSRMALRISRRFDAQVVLPVGSVLFASAMLLLAFWHDSFPHVLAVMAIGGLGGGLTFSSLPILIVPHVAPAETGSTLAFNMLLRYVGFSVGSAASVAMLELLGGDQRALRVTILIMVVISLGAAVAAKVGAPGPSSAGSTRAPDSA